MQKEAVTNTTQNSKNVIQATERNNYPLFVYQKGQLTRKLTGQHISVTQKDSLKYALKVSDGGYNFQLTFQGAEGILTDKHIRVLRALFNCYKQTDPRPDGSKIISLRAIYNAYILETPTDTKRRIPKKQEKELIEALDLIGGIRTKIDVRPLSKPKTTDEKKLIKQVEQGYFRRRDNLIDIAIDQAKARNGHNFSYVIIKNNPLYFQIEDKLIKRISTRKAELYSTPSIERYNDEIVAIKWELVKDIERIKSSPNQSPNVLLDRYYNLVSADTKYKKKRVRETIETLIINLAENGLIVVPYLNQVKTGKRTIFEYPTDPVTGTKQKNKGYRCFKISRQGINASPRNAKPKN